MAEIGNRINKKLIYAGIFGGGVLAALVLVTVIALVLGYGPFSDDPEVRVVRSGRAPQATVPPAQETKTIDEEVNIATEPPPQETETIDEGLHLVGIIPSPRIVHLQGPGTSEQISLQGYYSDSSVGDLDGTSRDNPSYTSSNPDVAEVNSRGLVEGEEVGGTNVTVSYG